MPTKKDHYIQQYTENDMPGYAAISEREKLIYGNQEPMHWATIVPFELGGEDPLWAVDCFNSDKYQPHFHYITAGFSNLYFEPEYAEDKFSGFGFEITFRHLQVSGDPERPIWPVNFLQNIAKYVFKSGKGFDEYHYMSANGPIRSGTDSQITAFAFYIDPEMESIDTPHGKLLFIQLYGLTSDEYNSIRNKEYTAKELLTKTMIHNPWLITDLSRK
jgi:hypothetical protein